MGHFVHKKTDQDIEAKVPAEPPPVGQGRVPERTSSFQVDNIWNVSTTNLWTSDVLKGNSYKRNL